MIKIIGLGPGAPEALTIGTIEALKNIDKVYLRTEKHPTVQYIESLGVKFETYDNAYDNFDTFDEVYNFIAEDLINKHEKEGDLIYAVPGHPFVAEKSVKLLVQYCKEKSIDFEIVPAVSFVDVVMERLQLDPIEGLKIVDAFECKDHIFDKRIGTIITQVYDQYIASEVKLALSAYYKDDTMVYFVRAAGINGQESIRPMALYEIDRQTDIDYLTSIYIPKDLDNYKDFYDLVNIMERLRGDNGCPWDKEQTHESLKRYLVEECYEVLEAIDQEDEDKITEELGDVLLQVVFHSVIAEEEGYFTIRDVIEGICNKMIQRHPHVFGDVTAENSKQVLKNWEEIKKEEQGMTTLTEEMEHIAKNLPALMRAEKVQNKAKKVGFDWDRVEDALDKVLEEFKELKEVYNGESRARILEEMGDLLFSVVNVSRFLEVNPEEALNSTTKKFIDRFKFIEEAATEKGLKLESMTLEQMDELWIKAKNLKKQ
ncbi:MAG: nucleoside triphosphate pyrophosphohydrolase [Clostridiales bacterium]|uniref:nucleoside triphosphate pyrophosphohydrolase n=1 Tax=Clostridium sp. N3C TaxID=1776758 RepID=UPI00092E18C9|nr:nucleoside triphosphate pyrophosphohydrolase [Clostridium sp. N3C]NLZ48347.1 nucleoside triphosphate pyrophosphohydrolase [Clostridiales bacterium]SCN23126.1 Nucleoside triphosphate pyrophosphohydrolase/pyrophosphatase MazG [Clostridium sp. N3C]